MFGFHFQPVSMSAKKRIKKKKIRAQHSSRRTHCPATHCRAVQANFPWYWFSAFSCVHKIWIIRYINHNEANHFRCVCITELKLNLFVFLFLEKHAHTQWLTDWVEHLAFDSVSKGRYMHRSWSIWTWSQFVFFFSLLIFWIPFQKRKKCKHSIQKYYTGSFHSFDPLSLILYRPVCLFCHGTWYKSFFWMRKKKSTWEKNGIDKRKYALNVCTYRR